MTDFRSLLLALPLLGACAGSALPPIASPLLVARTAATADGAVRLATDHSVLRLAGTLPDASCLRGTYTVANERVTVQLQRQPAAPNCAAAPGQPGWEARVGPLSPGTYRVRVLLDGKPALAEQRVAIR